MNVFLQIAALFILMAVGFAVAKLRIVDTTAVKGMSNLIVKATLPALIVMSLQKPFSRELLGASLQTLLVAFVFYVAIIALSLIAVRVLRVPGSKAGALAFSLSFSNCAFIGFPVVTSILGEGALFLTSIHNIFFNVLAFSAGILIVANSRGKTKADPASAPSGNGVQGETPAPKIPLGHLLNVNVIAAIIGFAFFVLSVTIPKAIALPLQMLGGLTTPLAMVVTGAMLARTPIRKVVGDWRLYAVTALRLIVWPALTAVVLRLCHVTGELYYITVVIAGMPAASNTSLIAEVYGGDTDAASAIVFMTTLFSVITIPVWAMLLT
jgi:predicted permease